MTLHLPYVLVPLLAYLCAGGLKFLINSLRAGRLATSQVGLGGFPSTHTSIISSGAFTVCLERGWDSAEAALAAAIVLIVVIDAMDLRRRVGRHAEAINALMRATPGLTPHEPLRERMGHHVVEVLGGLLVGAAVALGVRVLHG
ncbi:MAG: divergent PAP2 family protein [Aquabacterium sp.]|nr:divergent PAP2 family protein [Aquabacterium sp.]